jgi:hypothetical protein
MRNDTALGISTGLPPRLCGYSEIPAKITAAVPDNTIQDRVRMLFSSENVIILHNCLV